MSTRERLAIRPAREGAFDAQEDLSRSGVRHRHAAQLDLARLNEVGGSLFCWK
jgi:hypothetical protein